MWVSSYFIESLLILDELSQGKCYPKCLRVKVNVLPKGDPKVNIVTFSKTKRWIHLPLIICTNLFIYPSFAFSLLNLQYHWYHNACCPDQFYFCGLQIVIGTFPWFLSEDAFYLCSDIREEQNQKSVSLHRSGLKSNFERY